jgi:hypothetical protein
MVMNKPAISGPMISPTAPNMASSPGVLANTSRSGISVSLPTTMGRITLSMVLIISPRI